MVGFNWNEFYAMLEKKIKDKYPDCTVGRYITPKESEFPYVDIALGGNSGSGYDLSGNEGGQIPLIVISVYEVGNLADGTCSEISDIAKEIILSYGFQCKSGPLPVPNATDMSISRWVGRYQRVFGNGDILKKLQ